MVPDENSRTDDTQQQIEDLKKRVSELETLSQSLKELSSDDEKLAPPITVSIRAAKRKEDDRGFRAGTEKGFGFVILTPDQLENVDLSDIPEDSYPALIRAAENGLFVHGEDIQRASPYNLDGLMIVPTKIEHSDKGFKITSAETDEEYRRNRQQALIGETKHELMSARTELRETLEQPQFTQLVNELKTANFTTLPDEQLEALARRAVSYRYNTEGGDAWGITEKIEFALREAKYVETSNVFDLESTKQDGFIDQANKLQRLMEKAGIETSIEVHKNYSGKIDSVDLVVQMADEPYKKLVEGYEKAVNVDRELALRGLLDKDKKSRIGYIGRFSGENISHHGNWGDSFVSEAYSDREPPIPDTITSYLSTKDFKPVNSRIVWRRNIDNKLDFDGSKNPQQIKGELEEQYKWEKIGKDAEKLLSELNDKNEFEKKEKEEAAEFIRGLTAKLGIPQATPDSSVESEWLGMKIEAVARHDHTGLRGGSFINHSCVLTLPDGSTLDLARPGEWEDDVRAAAEMLKDAWEKNQPEGAVVEYETKKEAVYRLEGFVYNKEILQSVIDGYWDASYSEATLFKKWDEGGRDMYERFPEVPFPGIRIEDTDDTITHVLVLHGIGINGVEVGSIAFFPSKYGGYYGEVKGPPTEEFYNTPKDKISTLLREHPEADPRLINLEWRAVNTNS